MALFNTARRSRTGHGLFERSEKLTVLLSGPEKCAHRMLFPDAHRKSLAVCSIKALAGAALKIVLDTTLTVRH